ncbi:3-dehydroquinate synthase [Cardiobacterium valvarum]|uniref:3-dehydroquinate synthase n=1 Tax=Cardiobacterium valvarum F0432 TaxID=797473 RepID=G9ZCZ5_9GAMM|nr:3-dehydroquinate synthase [Cardiobacterium valvarum]EHM55585.1 3-dehydroquinate synthase [Cardiobacterium valvarum F0432]
MNTLTVNLPAGAARSYPIHIGHGLLHDRDLLASIIPQRQICIVTNDNVASHYLAPLTAALAGKTVITVHLPDGEAHKNLASYAQILDALVAARYDRDSLVIALGGGITGDIAGFAAATYQRGIAGLQIPTTLLAQVDSSVGGKTGVNHPQGKNLIGAFHQPQAVLIDTATLATLPPREYAAGMAEVIKYGLINDPGFFTWLEANRDGIRAHDPALLAEMIAHCCANKAAIVAADEREQGMRALLNYGHTFGHALEALTHYKRWKHGEAVVIGSVIATRLGVILGRVSEADTVRTAALFAAYDLPTTIPADITTAAILDKMQLDKKTRGGTLRLVLPQCFCDSGIDGGVAAEAIRQAIDACRA